MSLSFRPKVPDSNLAIAAVNGLLTSVYGASAGTIPGPGPEARGNQRIVANNKQNEKFDVVFKTKIRYVFVISHYNINENKSIQVINHSRKKRKLAPQSIRQTSRRLLRKTRPPHEALGGTDG